MNVAAWRPRASGLSQKALCETNTASPFTANRANIVDLKYSKLKNEGLCFIRWECLGLQARETLSQVTLRELSQGGGGKSQLYRTLQQGAGSLNIKRLLLAKENQISQIKELSAFLFMGRYESLGSLKSFLACASQLSGASIL